MQKPQHSTLAKLVLSECCEFPSREALEQAAVQAVKPLEIELLRHEVLPDQGDVMLHAYAVWKGKAKLQKEHLAHPNDHTKTVLSMLHGLSLLEELPGTRSPALSFLLVVRLLKFSAAFQQLVNRDLTERAFRLLEQD